MITFSGCHRRSSFVCGVTAVCLLGGSEYQLDAAQNEVDVFMERVLERSDENWVQRQDYVLDEHETFLVLGPGNRPVHRSDEEFAWYVEDGFLVRSAGSSSDSILLHLP